MNSGFVSFSFSQEGVETSDLSLYNSSGMESCLGVGLEAVSRYAVSESVCYDFRLYIVCKEEKHYWSLILVVSV